MHDVGHCFYSHLSESIYGNLKDFVELKRDIKAILGVKPKPHEILSLIIINSDSFKKFFSETINYPNKGNVDKLLEDVGKIIIGVNITAGLALDCDIECLFTKIKVHTLLIEGKIENRLVIQANVLRRLRNWLYVKI